MEMREGRTGTDPVTGRRVVVRGGKIVYADAPVQKTQGGANSAYQRKLDTAAAEETIAVRERAANAPSQIANAKQLLAELPKRRTGPGAEIGMTLGALGVPGSGGQQNAAFQRRLNAFASKGVLADAATIKPISNSDIAFLQTLQAGANQSPEANRQFLIASDWADQLAVANQTARDRWAQRFGSPNARDRQGRDFATFWVREYPKLFPRPNFSKVPQGKGYDFRQQRQGVTPSQPAKGGNDMSRMTDDQLRALIARGQ
jgi:hypothetical protein